ncbi:MAG: AAA family ATPase [Candidatus Aegiribacteria sp.]|nr:AAA family ATPase [Candidatus Aegiribacteria sp.]
MFSRDIVNCLKKWYGSDNRKPILIRGVRQCGKTSAVRLFADGNPGYMEINLEAPGEKDVFRRNLKSRELLSAIRLSKGVTAPLDRSILFIDEIQACPEAIKYLRYLFEDVPELAVIASGSLLELYLANESIQFPVGRVEHAFMYPVTFREFLRASAREDMIDELNNVPVPSYAVPVLYKAYVDYAILGGMPEVLNAKLEGAELEELSTVYSSLMISFLDDIPKYASNRTMSEVIRHCLESAPSETGNRITYAGFGGSSYRSREAGEAIRTLEKAMLLHLVHASGSMKPPIRENRRKSPKLLFVDSGLLMHLMGAHWETIGTEDLNSAFRGILAEQCIGQAIAANHRDRFPALRFWARDKRGSSAEVDFLLQQGDRLIPVEVKSGATGRLRSVHRFMEDSKQDIAVRFYSGEVRVDSLRTQSGREFTLFNLPHFLVGQLHEYLDWLIEEHF